MCSVSSGLCVERGAVGILSIPVSPLLFLSLHLCLCPDRELVLKSRFTCHFQLTSILDVTCPSPTLPYQCFNVDIMVSLESEVDTRTIPR